MSLKKTIVMIFIIIFLFISIYSLIDIIRSVWYVLVYESINASAFAIVLGKVLFFVIIFVIFLFLLKTYKKIKKLA